MSFGTISNGNETDERAFGPILTRYLGQNVAPTALAHTPLCRPLAVTRVWTADEQVCESRPIPSEDAFHLILQCREMPPHDLWLDGRLTRTEPYPRHSVSIIDLRRSSRTRIASAHEALVFYLDRKALDEIAEEYGSPSIDGLSLKPGIAAIDPVMARLGQSLRPALVDQPDMDQLLVDQFMLLMHAHVARTYGALRPVKAISRGGLALWQERRAKERIAASVGRHLSLSDVARDVSLSVSHFSRSFRQSTGMSPHRWLVRQRMDAAKAMLLANDLTIAEITLATGYAEQSSFTKAFLQSVGMSPAAWRRNHKH